MSLKFRSKKEEPEPVNAEYQKAIGVGQKKRTHTRTRTEKPLSPFKRTMKGQSRCVTVKKLAGPYYETTESWMQLNEASIMALGYRPAYNYNTKSSFGKTYIRFVGFEKHPCMRPVMEADGTVIPGEFVVQESLETASSLADYMLSDSQERFIESMRAKKFSGPGNYKLIVFFVIIVIGLIGGYLYMTGRS